jgi:hypothetical protein
VTGGGADEALDLDQRVLAGAALGEARTEDVGGEHVGVAVRAQGWAGRPPPQPPSAQPLPLPIRSGQALRQSLERRSRMS